MKNESTLKNSKPVFSGHETFPLRYGWLKKVYDAATAVEEKKGNISKDLFNNIEAISILGVGKNMVSSMRYWALYTGILAVNEDKNLYVTDYAKKIFADIGFDPWLENYALTTRIPTPILSATSFIVSLRRKRAVLKFSPKPFIVFSTALGVEFCRTFLLTIFTPCLKFT